MHLAFTFSSEVHVKLAPTISLLSMEIQSAQFLGGNSQAAKAG